ncbi:MAG: hypothetical protein JJE42_18950, partial [Burkholderiales bacterium]|nr:hypothetical protein [Burkholderiales bacterium]
MFDFGYLMFDGECDGHTEAPESNIKNPISKIHVGAGSNPLVVSAYQYSVVTLTGPLMRAQQAS